MANRYSVVLRTYPRRLFLGTLFLQVFLILCGLATTPRTHDLLVAMGNVGLGLFAVMMVLHVQEQFADPRALLVPGFGAPHLAVAAAISTAVLALTTAVICWRAGTSISGTAAAVLVPFTAIVSGMYQPWALAMMLIILFAGGAMFAPGADRLPGLWYAALLEGRALPIALVLLVVCLGLLVMVGARILRLNEDMPDYHRGKHLNPAKAGAERRCGWQTEWQPSLLVRRMPTYRAGAEPGLWQRVILWRACMSPYSVALVVPGFLVLSLVLSLLVAIISRQMTPEQVGDAYWFFGWYGPVFFWPVVAIMWQQRWPRLGYELLRPATRRDFCRQLGLAVALDLSQGWLWNALFVGFIVAVLSPALLRGIDIVVFLCLTGVIPLLQWPASVVVLSYSPSDLLLFITVFPVSLPPAFLWTAYCAGWGPAAISFYLATALGTLLLCAVTLYLAYRRWLNLDLA